MFKCDVMRLLVVEDDDGQFQTYEDAAEDFNESNDECQLELEREKNAESAKIALLSGNYDGGIVDINLDPNHSSESSGNTVLEEIIGKYRFPVFVVSGNLGGVKQEILDKSSLFLKFYNREKPNDEIFNEFFRIYKTSITKILRGDGELEKRLGDIFWKHFSHDLDVWLETNSGSGSKKASSLLRYTLNHLTEYIDIDPSAGHFYNDAEFYIKPPIKPYLATGDVVEKNNDFYILLSPACDVAVRGLDEDEIPVINSRQLILAKLIRVERASFLENGIIREEDNAKIRESVLEKIIRSQNDQYVFLPSYKDIPATVIDLKNIYSIEYYEYFDGYERMATVTIPFLKEIQARFSSYMGRQGTPDLNKKNLLKKHKSSLSCAS